MGKTIYITDDNIAILKEHFGNIDEKGNFDSSQDTVSLIKDNVDSDEYELGDDGGGMSAYYHVKDSDNLNEWVQYDFDKDRVNRITYSVNVDDDEDGNLEEYEGEAYDTDGHSISYFSGDIDDMRNIFGDEIAEMIAAHEGDYHGGEYDITDIAYMGTSNVDLSNPQEVNNAVKKISKSDGDSYYILTDGTVVGFWDHIEIKAIDGLTISKFLEMGNIRCRHNSVETMKMPTSEQAMVLKGIIRDADQVYVDFSKPNHNGSMYPENVFSVRYANPNPNRIVNDIINYYSNGVRPLGENKKKTIAITEEQADSIKRILTESQESKSISAAKKLVMQKLNYDEQQADEFVRIKLRNDLPVLRTPQGGKFILGVTRMFCDGELRSANDIGNLNSTLKLVASDAHINEYDRNLNGMSAQDLIRRFSKAMSDNLEAEKAEIGQMSFDTQSDYEIVRIDSFEQAEEYGQYVSWCVTHDERMFNSYTSDGINQFYFCLKHGFENVKPQPSEGCPLDEYGLSMIAVSVNENGMLNTCTCRWNHDNGGDDSIMSAKEISQVIGMNFFEVFKPNNKWKELVNNVMQRLANGVHPVNLFRYRGSFHEGFAWIKLSNKWNFINQERRILSDQWFDWCGDFREGFAAVELNAKYNFINQEGRILSDQWFDFCGDFRDGFAEVELNNKRNFINQEGRILSDQWFDFCGDFSEGFAEVKLNDKYNFIDQEGRYLSDQWFDWGGYFHEGFARVELNGKCNFINQEGGFLSDQWFDDVYSFSEGLAKVKLNGRYNFINQECRFLSNQWFDGCDEFNEGIAKVRLDGKWNFINQGGRFLSDQWFDDACPFRWGGAKVMLNGKKYRIDTDGYLTPLRESKKVNGSLITENTFESWFRNSVLVDAEGNPIKMYHGTDKEFNAFSKDFIGRTGSFEGYGFNFTPFYGRAVSYNSKNVIEAYLRAERPMTTKSNKMTLSMVMKIISELDKGKPYTDTIVAAYESPKYNENWDASYYRRALPVASKVILEYNKENGYGDAGVYAEICVNGNADIKKTIEVFERLGYDSAIFYDKDGRINTVIVFEPNQIKLTKNTTYNDESEVMSENVEMELDASDVKLDSFKINKSLAPKIWDGLDLNPRVRLRLLDIADDFWETVGITWVRPCGIKLTGSICNYNWSKFSDIDLHLIVDFSKVDDRIDFVREYFDGKKNEWNNEHEHLKLYGFPVELYVEDIHDETSSDGQYDLEENKWITKPSESFKPIGLDKYYIKNIVSKYATKIEDLKDELETTDDSHKLEVLGKKADSLWKKIKAMRKYGLQRSGESDPFNIAYKCYRRMGYLDMLFDIKSQQYDKVNSIGINESIDDNIFSKLKAHYGTTYDIRECGYVLPDGTMLDFSGKHKVDDVRDKEQLSGRRTTDHRDVTSIGVNMSDVIKSGAIRIDCNAAYANLYVKPTREQIDVLNRFIRRNNGCVMIEIGDGDASLSYCEYEDVRPMKVINAILRYFDDGIRLESDIREGEKKTVTITEEQAAKIREVLTESQESKSISAAKKLVMQKLNYDERQADEFIRIKLRNDLPVLRTPQGGKFILGATRMFCDGELRSANDISNLNSTLKLVASDAHINEYDRNLNGMTYQDLIQRFSRAMSDNIDAEKAEIGQMTFDTPSDYEIVRIDSFEQAEEYGQYVSWCVTHDERMFDSYTSDGINQFYFCLKHGFENVKPQPSDGCPLDEYGLSMIAVSVNENGMLNTCTCRWNHDNGGNDGIMSAKEVSQVIGMNFFEVFKPNNKWKELINNVMQRLANGEDPNNVFDDCGDFEDGFAWVELNGKCNFISQEGELLSDQWFDQCSVFREGFIAVSLNGKWNFIDQEGRFLSNQWFGGCSNFSEGFARVRLNGKHNFINQEGRLLSDQWFDDAYSFSEGLAKVKLNGRYNFINQECRFLSDQWFDNCGDFHEGFAAVRLNRKWNFINQESRLLSDQWLDYCGDFHDGFAAVGLDDKWNFISQEGRLLSDQWFDDCDRFKGGFAEVVLNGKKYKIDTNGNLRPLNESEINDKSLIREYLEKDHNMPLYRYFKWVKESSECEKAEDLAYECSDYIAKYIKRIRNRFPAFGKLVNINDEFYFEDDEKIEKFCALLKEYDLCGNFIAIMQDIVNGYGWYNDLPTWCTTDFIRIVKNEWCIHFTSDANNIVKYGLTGGTDDISHLAYTNAGQDKHQEGYNFAFLIDDRDVDNNEYGNEAVIFRTSGVEIYHYGDMQHQVIFWGPNVKSFIPIKFDGNEGDWVVYGGNGQILKSGNPSDIAEWATENLPQYRKQIMAGKNGYIPQQTIYDPKTYKVSHKPYPLYQNESIQKYLTLLKEEVVADGNADNNVYAKKWKNERETLKRFILQNGTLMTSKENGKTYKVYFDQSLSNLIGINYCICLQYDQYTMVTGNTVYVRALDKFTSRMFRPHFDTRGLDNMSGTNDDNIDNY